MPKANVKSAPAQGIAAQVRIFGGSLGIAASSAILQTTLQAQVGGSITSQQISSAKAGVTGSDSDDMAMIRRAYADAFRQDMRVCTIIAGIALLWALGTYSRTRIERAERREQQVKQENKRRKIATADSTRQQENTKEAV